MSDQQPSKSAKDNNDITPQFGQFPYLPAELRDEVWQFAAQETNAPGVCFLTLEPKVEGTGLRHKPLMSEVPRNKNVAASCQQARDVAPKTHIREYNPATDILYLNREGFDYFTMNLCGRLGLPWAASVRHLAFSLWGANRGLHLPLALKHMKSLETIAVVYPKTSGEVDCCAKVPRPRGSGATLRVFTPQEMNSLTVTANYQYDTPVAGLHPIRWRKSVQEHLSLVESDLSRHCSPGNANPVPSLWDYENKRLNLTYRAMCFTP